MCRNICSTTFASFGNKMKLKEESFLFIDCQTTGMRPSVGQLLEIAWHYGQAGTSETALIESHLVRLPDGEEVPKRVQEITGIDCEKMKAADTFPEVFAALNQTLAKIPQPVTAIIHYAQFERPFLADLFQRFGDGTDLPMQIFCSHRILKRVLPNLPSQNIRAAAGYFGAPVEASNRAGAHVRATMQIWNGLAAQLELLGVTDREALESWLRDSPKSKATRYEYRLDKIKRLELPHSPGIYRMISKSGGVLYVGKATSLKSRVNSYFRGKKGRDQRKLEMLAQVWDIRVTDCATPLEAALLETDEIKRYNPPYNVVLKRGRRHLVFYTTDFTSVSTEPSNKHCVGPFRNFNWIESLRTLHRSLGQDAFEAIFFEPIPGVHLRLGFELFCKQQHLSLETFKSVRSFLAKGLWLERAYVEPLEVIEDPAEPPTDEFGAREFTLEELAGKYERLLRRAGLEYRRTRRLTQLLNARISIPTPEGPRELHFARGSIQKDGAESLPRTSRLIPWLGLTIDDYDRMSILNSELGKYEYEIEPEPHAPDDGSAPSEA